MSDDFLGRFREQPPPRFVQEVRQRLKRIEAEASPSPKVRRVRRALTSVLAAAASVLIVTGLLSIPSVRAAAREFLVLFRVQRFAAVPVDASRFARLEQKGLDLKTLIGSDVETLERPGEPQVVDDPAAAAAIAEIPVLVPGSLPRDAVLKDIAVRGRGSARLVIDVRKIEELVAALGLTDVQVPDDIHGKTVTIEMPPQVVIRYRRGNREWTVVQSRSPEVALPEGLDLARLGELGLRAAGLDSRQARRFAQSLDWRSTLLVPVPVGEGDYGEIELRGTRGLLIRARVPRPPAADGERKPATWQAVLLWAEAGRVFAVAGDGEAMVLVDMAESLRKAS